MNDDITNKNEIKLDEIQKKDIEEGEDIFETDLLKYNFDHTTKFNSINYLNLDYITKQKFLLLILLMSSKLNFFNKIISLEHLYFLYYKEKNYDMIYYLMSKLIKYLETYETSVHMINTSFIFFSDFLINDENNFFAFKILNDLKNINENVTLDINTKKIINKNIKQKIYEFYNYFKTLINDEHISILENIINNLLKQKESNDNNDINTNNKILDDKNEYFYIINKSWLKNAKNFFKSYFISKKLNTVDDFYSEAFNLNNISSIYLTSEKNNQENKKDNNINYYPYPGPINNFAITEFKDILYDPLNTEENYIIKKNIKENEDYIYIEKKDWLLLSKTFNSTNELKRKKNEKEMISMNTIIFDNRIRKYKKECINYLKKKLIQIHEKKSLENFEQKIIRCMNYEFNNIKIKNKEKLNDNDNNNENIIMKLYKVNKNNKDIIIEMFLSFINDITPYESIFFQEIILLPEDKGKNIKELYKKYNPKKEILIIEINEKNNPQFLLPINSVNLLCSICNKPIKDFNDTKYMCELCSMYIFCSKNCAKIENINNNQKIISHFTLHKYLSDLIIKQFNFDDFVKLKINFDDKEIYSKKNNSKNINKGIIGLYNLGNTCYMNCSLQCLSHTKDLTKYFLNKNFQNDINTQTKFGSNGVLLKSYYDLINLMWLSDEEKIIPNFFRNAFIESTNKFRNNYQQDAMEFISILLNYFNEDLNHIREKYYSILEPQKENESDIQASERFYKYNLLRENSIIINLFNGQFQNIIKCTVCNKENKTYEPFNNITLPIPDEHNFYIIKFFTHLKCKYITININSDTTFGELVKKATKYLSKNILDSFENIKKEYSNSPEYVNALLEKNIEIVKLDKNKVINEIYSQPENENDIKKNYLKKLKKYINKEEEIILFERELIPDYLQNIYVYPIMIDKKDEKKINFLSYPVVFSVKHDLSLENLEKLINEKFQHILINDPKIIKNNHIIDLHILHSNKNLNTGLMKIVKDYPKCKFCGSDYSIEKFCPLYKYFNKKDKVSKIFKISKYSEPFVILARSSYYDIKKEVYPEYYFEENNILNKHKNLYDSLNQFGNYECLGDDNLWDCPYCHKKRKINKAIKIFRVPNYLIIQLKRFKKKSFFNFLDGDKNETFVSFPIKNLDLSNYIEGPGKINGIYNLYAVINHKSIMGCNHFTAFCKNNNVWYEYDDHRVNHIDNPVTNDAYILFYSKANN